VRRQPHFSVGLALSLFAVHPLYANICPRSDLFSAMLSQDKSQLLGRQIGEARREVDEHGEERVTASAMRISGTGQQQFVDRLAPRRLLPHAHLSLNMSNRERLRTANNGRPAGFEVWTVSSSTHLASSESNYFRGSSL
jgi:hypothetical protein